MLCSHVDRQQHQVHLTAGDCSFMVCFLHRRTLGKGSALPMPTGVHSYFFSLSDCNFTVTYESSHMTWHAGFTPKQAAQAQPAPAHSPTDPKAIIGGVIGGVAGAVILALLVRAALWKRHHTAKTQLPPDSTSSGAETANLFARTHQVCTFCLQQRILRT